MYSRRSFLKTGATVLQRALSACGHDRDLFVRFLNRCFLLANGRDGQRVVGRMLRLRLIDPGIVPQRPSSPNIPLNVFAALLFGAVASVLYLSVAFQSRPPATRQPIRLAAKKADG